jgi:hypothetical protein
MGIDLSALNIKNIWFLGLLLLLIYIWKRIVYYQEPETREINLFDRLLSRAHDFLFSYFIPIVFVIFLLLIIPTYNWILGDSGGIHTEQDLVRVISLTTISLFAFFAIPFVFLYSDIKLIFGEKSTDNNNSTISSNKILHTQNIAIYYSSIIFGIIGLFLLAIALIVETLSEFTLGWLALIFIIIGFCSLALGLLLMFRYLKSQSANE